MLTSDNVSEKQIKNVKVMVIFIDIRNSSEINKVKQDKEELHEMYSNFFTKTFSILKNNGFENIDIQGDGIYGVSDKEKSESSFKALIELNNLELNNIKFTISVNYGEEYYGAFGSKENKNKQLAFFGNIVSMSKKYIQYSTPETKIICTENAYKFLSNSSNDITKFGMKKKGNKVKKWKSYW